MVDQAEALRRKVEQYKETQTKVLGVLSGKGGVGKSVFAVNFALALNQLGKRIVLIDLDIGMGNVDILLDVHANYHFADMIDKRIPIEDMIIEHKSGLSIISGGSGLSDLFGLDDRNFDFFLEQFTRLKRAYDMIIFDLGAGFTNDTLRFISSVHEAILVTTTEPPALADAYAVIKMMTIKNVNIPIHCVINRYENSLEEKITWDNLQYTTERFLKKKLSYLGGLPRDTAVIKAVKTKTPFIIGEPKANISLGLHQLALRYLKQEPVANEPTLDSFIDKLKFFFRSKG